MEPKTLAALVHIFCADQGIPSNRKAMTKTAARHASNALGFDSPARVPIHRAISAQMALETYLPTLDLSDYSQRNYRSFYSRFIVWAQDKKLLPRTLIKELSPEWYALTHPLKDVKSGRKGHRDALRKLAQWCMGYKIQPLDLTTGDLKAYSDYMVNASGVQDWRQVYNRTPKEWNRHVENGAVHSLHWPTLPNSTRSVYGLNFKDWPQHLQEDYTTYRKWCTDSFRIDRPRQYKQREITADQYLSVIQRIFGFAHRIQGVPIDDLSMDTLFDKTLIYAYVQWMINIRLNGKLTCTVENTLGRLLGIANGYFKENGDVEWLLLLQKEVSGAPVRDKKAMAFSISELNSVPDGIHEQRIKEKERANAAGRKPGKKRQARLFMFELMLRLCIKRLLRRKNLCEIRIGTNLIDNGDHHYILRFEPDEMKGAREFVTYIPTSLVSLLEEYLEHHRPHLLDGFDSDYLFPAPREKHISGDSVLNFFRRHSLRILDKPLTPHLVRHSVAIEFLKKHPGQYLTLSKMLQHSSVKITIDQYAHFDNQDAAEIFDKMMEEDDDEEKDNNKEES